MQGHLQYKVQDSKFWKDTWERSRKNKLVAGSSNKYKLYVKNNDTNMEKERLKCFVLLKEFKEMSQGYKALLAENYLLQKIQYKALSKNSAKRRMGWPLQKE